MAKFRISNNKRGYRDVECNILNESCGKFVIEVENGATMLVSKNRVHNLNKIDEGVLDWIKDKFTKLLANIGIAFKKVGKYFRFLDKNGKDLGVTHPINSMVYARTSNDITFIPDENLEEMCSEIGEKCYATINLDDSEPIGDDVEFQCVNTREGFQKQLRNLVFEYDKEMGDAVEQYYEENQKSDNGDIRESAMNETQYLDYATRGTGSEYDTVEYEDEEGNDMEEDKHKRFIRQMYMSPVSESPSYKYMRMSELYDLIDKQITRAALSGQGTQRPLPILMWGAPGVGKTSIVKKIVEDRRRNNVKFSLLSLNARAMQQGDTNLPTSRAAARLTNVDTFKATAAEWLPCFDKGRCMGNRDLIEFYDNIANGGYWKLADGTTFGKIGMTPEGEFDNTDMTKFKVQDPEMFSIKENGLEKIEGNGGIIFVDEVSRVSPEVMNELMTMFLDGTVGTTGLTLGSKWVMVGAANRLSDLTSRDREKAILDAAQSYRFQHLGFVLTLKEFLDYAKENVDWVCMDGKVRKEQRIIPLVTGFLENKKYRQYFYFSEQEKENTSGASSRNVNYQIGDANLAKANPRQWEQFSNAIKTYCDPSIDYNDPIAIPYSLLETHGISCLGHEVFNKLMEYRSECLFIKDSDIDKLLNMNPSDDVNDLDVPKNEWFDTRFEGLYAENILNKAMSRIKVNKDDETKYLDPDQIYNIFKYVVAYCEKCGKTNDGKVGGETGMIKRLYSMLSKMIVKKWRTETDLDNFSITKDFDKSQDYARCKSLIMNFLKNAEKAGAKAAVKN